MSPGDGTFVDNPTLKSPSQWLTDQYARSQVLSGNWIVDPEFHYREFVPRGLLPLPPDFR